MYVRMYKKNAIIYYTLFYTHKMYFFYISHIMMNTRGDLDFIQY